MTAEAPIRQWRKQMSVAAILPLAIFAGVGAVLYWGLWNTDNGLPSPLIGKSIPEFDLPPVEGRILGLSSTDIRGEVSLVNVFASWCLACREEHPLFMELSAQNAVPLYGLNYKDQPAEAANWLDTLGDPYTRTGADISGRVAIEWGVYGVPETFVVGPDGRIAYKHIGAVTRQVLDETILPLVESLRQTARASTTMSSNS